MNRLVKSRKLALRKHETQMVISPQLIFGARCVLGLNSFTRSCNKCSRRLTGHWLRAVELLQLVTMGGLTGLEQVGSDRQDIRYSRSRLLRMILITLDLLQLTRLEQLLLTSMELLLQTRLELQLLTWLELLLLTRLELLLMTRL